MGIAIRTLKQELRSWKESDKVNRRFYKGEEKNKNAIGSFKEHKKAIADLERAISILNNN